MNVSVDKPNNRLLIIVADDQLSLAIGRAGQNARLAAKLTNWKLDIKSENEYKKMLEEERRAKVPIEEIPGVGKKTSEALYSIGIETAHDLVNTSKDELLAVPGIGVKTATSLLSAAKKKLKAQQILMAKEKEEAEQREQQSQASEGESPEAAE
jgi:N utilization substance protein A